MHSKIRFRSATAKVKFAAQNQGPLSLSVWNFGDGTTASNQPFASHAWSLPGDYEVRLTGYNESNPGGISATVLVRVEDSIYYVNASNPTPAYPYTNWATAAQTIQEAVDARDVQGRLVLVTNGIYNAGGRAVQATMTNRVVLSGVVVRSVNGPDVTQIVGAGVGGGNTNGDGAIRCAYVGTNAFLSGFTLTNGHTRITGGNNSSETGGGVWCEASGVVSNCVLTGNSAAYGGGSHDGTLTHCTLIGNSAVGGGGGGSHLGTLTFCTLTGNSANHGGGSFYSALANCTLTGNSSTYGGGSYNGSLNNCTMTGNSASYGGGSYDGTLNNCTLTGNSAVSGGGTYNSTLTNCIVYYNSAPDGSNYNGGTFRYSCTAPLPSGTSNITAQPKFVNRSGGDFRLMSDSPCINAGLDSIVQPGSLDLDGKARIWGAHIDLGAYEYVASSALPGFVGLTWITNEVPQGSDVQASVTLAPNNNPPSFQWFLNGSTPLPGQTTSDLALNSVKLKDAGVYSVMASNRNGSVIGTAMTLRVTYQIANPVWSSGNSNFSLGLQTELGRAYWLEARDDFETNVWTVITGLTNCAGLKSLSDTNATHPKRFYRTGSAPLP